MIETLSTHEVANRLFSDEYAGWSYAGAKALAEYLEGYEDDTGEPMEFDRVAIRCDFSEYSSALEAAGEYDYEEVVDLEPHGSVDLLEVADLEEAQAVDWLGERTQIIPFPGGVIIQQF